MIRSEHLDVYNVRLTTRAPLFIGSGKSYVKKEYVFLSPRVTRSPQARVLLLDEHRLFRLLVERNRIDQYETFMLGAQTDLYQFLTVDCRLTLQEILSLSRCTIDTGDALDASHSLKEIFAFVRDGNDCVYVPGSSLKGAIRTAFLTDAVLREGPEGHTAARLHSKGFEGDYINTLSLKKDRDGVAVNDAVNSMFQGIRLSDSLPVSDKAMMLAGKVDADIHGETHRINLCRECIRPGTELRFKLTLDRSVVDPAITGESLLGAIRRFDRFYESCWLKHFTPPRNAADVSYQDALLLGGGAGYPTKTLTYPYLGESAALYEVISVLSQIRAFQKHRHDRDREIGISPRTMKYAQYRGKLYPYGLCEVSIS